MTNFLPWFTWSLAAIFVVFNYVQQVFPDAVTNSLVSSLSANESNLSAIAAAYFYTYAILQIPVGIIIDRFNTKIPLVIAITCSAIGAFIFSDASTPMSALIARIIMGAGAAFSFIGCLKVSQEWFPPEKFSTLAGLTNTAAMIGAASGPLIALSVKYSDWREVMLGIGIAQLIVAVIILVCVKNSNAAPNKLIKSSPTFSKGNIGILTIALNPQVLLNAIFAATISLIFIAFGGLWGSNFIKQYFNIDDIKAENIGTFLFIGAILGSLFFGWFSDWISSRKKPMILGGLGGLLSLICLLYIDDLSIPAFEIALFLTGFFSSANIVSYAFARDLYPSYSGLSIGLLSSIFYAGGAASQQIVGALLSYNSKSEHISSINELSIQDFRFAFTSLAIFMFIGLICSFFIKDPSSK